MTARHVGWIVWQWDTAKRRWAVMYHEWTRKDARETRDREIPSVCKSRITRAWSSPEVKP